MPEMNLVQAINDALRIEMKRDEDVVVLGEDVGKVGGVFRVTQGLYDEFGDQRVIDTPLAVCDAASIGDGQLIATNLAYTERTGEIYSLGFSEGHRWLYYPQMRADEAMLLKCYDSETDGRARFTAHSAFRDPGAPEDAPARESIEVRTLAFFD